MDLVGLSIDHTVKFFTGRDEDLGLKEAYCPIEKELHTNYSLVKKTLIISMLMMLRRKSLIHN